MANYDEDAVLEAIARLQPQISALHTRIQALETSGGNVDLTDILLRLSALENTVVQAVHPHTVIQQYDDDTELTYKRS